MTNGWMKQKHPVSGANNFSNDPRNPDDDLVPLPPVGDDSDLVPIPPTGPSGPGSSAGFLSVLVRRRQKRREKHIRLYDKPKYWRRRNA